MSTTINGQPTKPMPASVTAGMKRGEPKKLAQSKGTKPVSTVRVK
ncbi:hypothetical protein [Sphingomonas sp. MA1305]|nr:hypothetical protein [Sphingomonas sp. MA1305]